MKEIRYVDEIGVKKILEIMTIQDQQITNLLGELSKVVVNMQSQVNELSDSISNINTSINTMNNAIKSTQDELSKISFDMGHYDIKNK